VNIAIRVIVGVCVDAQQAYCGCYGKLDRLVRFFLIFAGEISSTSVNFVQNRDLIGCISTRECENTLICVIDLSEHEHFGDV
jgi:hypothetical protein